MTPGTRRLLTVAAATTAFSVALLVKDQVNVWAVTAAAAVLSLALAAWSEGPRLARLLRPRRFDLVVGVGSAVALVAGTHLAHSVVSRLIPALDELVLPLYAEITEPPGALLALPLTALVVLAEEVIWRGVLLEELGRRPWGRTLTATVATAAYTIPHALTGNPALLAVAVVLGSAWTVLRLTTGGLMAPLVCHLLWSAALFVLWPVV